MSPKEFAIAVRRARCVFVAVPCTGTQQAVMQRKVTVQYFRISKTEAARVIADQYEHVAAVWRESALYIGGFRSFTAPG